MTTGRELQEWCGGRMTAVTRAAMRDKMLSALELFIDAFDAKPLYANIGEDATITFVVSLTTDPNRPWAEQPDPAGDGTCVDLVIRTTRSESW